MALVDSRRPEGLDTGLGEHGGGKHLSLASPGW